MQIIQKDPQSSGKRVDYNGWPLLVHSNGELPAITDWSHINRLPLRTILSSNWKNHRQPLYKICTIIGSDLNATLQSVVTKEEMEKPFSLLSFAGWAGYNSKLATVMVQTEGVRFVYCKNKTESISDLRVLLAPFDPITWFSIVSVIASMCGVFKLACGTTNLFGLLACMVCQGQVVAGKFVFLWVLWIFTNIGLTNLYTSFIESVLVAPSARGMLDDFEQLYRADYQIVIGKTEGMAQNFRKGLFGGTWYLNALRTNAEFVGKNFWDKEFLLNALHSGKRRAFLISGTQSSIIRYAFSEKLPWMDCHVSEAEIPLVFKGWAGRNPNALFIRNLVHRLYSNGILMLFTKAKEARWNKLFKLATISVLKKTFHQTRISDAMMAKYGGEQGHINGEFCTELSQARTIFITWLVALALALVIFAIEVTVGTSNKCHGFK